MPIYTLERSELVAMSLADCWDFFSDPRNLQKITPPDLGFEVKSDLPARVYPGLMIAYKVSPLWGIQLSWLTEIVHVTEPHYFVDEQRIGPYRLWHHEHFFSEAGNGQVEVRDLIHYVPPLGPLGAIINATVIRPRLESIFNFRQETLRKIRPASTADSFA